MSADAERCPNCGAALRDSADGQPDIPGVTQVDPSVAVRRDLPKANRLVGWLSGDVDVGPPPVPGLGTNGGAASAGDGETIAAADPGSIAPPSAEVRREMARLELEALKAQMEANASPAEPDDGMTATDAQSDGPPDGPPDGPAGGPAAADPADPADPAAADADDAADATPGTEPTERGDGAVA